MVWCFYVLHSFLSLSSVYFQFVSFYIYRSFCAFQLISVVINKMEKIEISFRRHFIRNDSIHIFQYSDFSNIKRLFIMNSFAFVAFRSLCNNNYNYILMVCRNILWIFIIFILKAFVLFVSKLVYYLFFSEITAVENAYIINWNNVYVN